MPASTAVTLIRAALPKLHPGSALPDLTLSRDEVSIDPRHVGSYAEVCGYPRKDTLPMTYPHLLAFGLHLQIMADRSFPFPAIGTVHLDNAITQHRPVALTETLHVSARAADLRAHPKGQLFDLLTTVSADGDVVWEERSTFLRRGRGTDDAPVGASYPDAPPTGAVWRLPGDLGRRYAAVSGDHNPIHLWRPTARALGFKRQIAHGMWSLARCVATLENRIPTAATVEVAFKKPILLPGQVAFGSRRLPDGYAFSLTDPKTGAPHLRGVLGAVG